MRMQTTNYLQALTTNEVAQLTTQVKETLAKEISTTAKTFTAADLWNIQKNKRSIRRNY